MRKIGTGLFMFAVSLGISITLMVIFELTGLGAYLYQNGYNYEALFLFCAFFGFAGSFIQLMISKWLARRMFRLRTIESTRTGGDEAWLFETTRMLAQKAGLPKTPEVCIYDSPEVNAFATGPSKSDSLVAVSTGLLSSMSRGEAQGVVAHEVAHIANGDMVRMTLMQGVINTLIMFAARILASVVASRISDRDNFMLRFGLVIAFEFALGFLGAIVVNTYSRRREYRADAGGAALGGKGNMIAALQALQARSQFQDKRNPQMAAFKISSGKTSKLAAMFSTHPPLEDRIRALQAG